MNISKRLAVIKRRFFHWLVLKTQAPEYYGRMQRRVRDLEYQLAHAKEKLECSEGNQRYYREQRDKMHQSIVSLKETRRLRGLPPTS